MAYAEVRLFAAGRTDRRRDGVVTRRHYDAFHMVVCDLPYIGDRRVLFEWLNERVHTQPIPRPQGRFQ